MDLFGKAMDSLGGSKEKPEFDKIRTSLKKLKGVVDKMKETQTFSKEAWKIIETAFYTDLNELNIRDKKRQKEMWGTIIRPAIETAILKETNEFKDLKKFTTKLENLAGLRKIIDSKEPKTAAESWFKGLKKKFPKFGWVFGYIGTYFAGMAAADRKKNKNKDTFFSKMYDKIAGWLGHKEKKPKKAETGQPTQTPAQKEAARKAAEKQKKYVDLFKNKGLILRTPEIDKDLKTLEKNGAKEADISSLLDASMKSGGNLEQILTAINKALHNKETPLYSFKLRLADLLYQQKTMTPEKLKRVVAAIKDKDSKVPKNLKDIRKFLDETNTDFEVAMKKYEKPKTA